MLRITQRAFGFLSLVSKQQFSRHMFNLGTLKSSKYFHGRGDHPSQTTYLYQQSGMMRRLSTSQTMPAKHDEGVNVRPATHADCGAIKAIDRDIHGGTDTFLYYFHHHINTDNRFTYVAEVSNQIVGYLSGHVIDDGDAIIIQDARVTEKHRGRATVLQLGHVLATDALVKFPNLQWLVFTLTDEDLVQQRLSRGARPLRIWTTPVEVFQVHSDELQALCKSEIFNGLEKKFNVDAINGFPKREALQLLIEEIRYLNFAPPRPMCGWQPSGWHVSTLADQLQITDLFITRRQQTNDIQSFSFLTTTRNDHSIEIGLSLYCDDVTMSEDLAIGHLLHAIREMAVLHSGTKITCVFHHPPTVSREGVKNVLNVQLGIPSNVDKDWTATVMEYRLLDPFTKHI